ncbi:MAG: single-stranded DNA-binding protein [Synergistaceae bacterium]|nr:single-stranded DNA-binding protein [Synergistaceae bacterium]
MRGYNRAIIAGNITRDPEVRYTVNKKAYARFSVAVNSRWKNANGEFQDSVEYINIVTWGVTAENCGKYLKKGSGVLVEGRISTSSYEAKDGSGKRYMTEIVADNIQFLSSGGQGQGGGSYSRQQAPQSAPQDFMPGDDDFGKSIAESNFGGFPPEFPNENLPQDNSDIPF